MNRSNYGNLNGYCQTPYAAEDMQTTTDFSNHDAMMGMMMGNGMSIDNSGMMGGQTLDDIIDMDDKETQRRRSFHQSQHYGASRGSLDPRRSSMMEFGSGNTGDLAGFQFDPSPGSAASVTHRPGHLGQRRMDNQNTRRQDSNGDLALNSHFQSLGPGYSPMVSSSPYHPSLQHSNSLPLDMSGDYMSNNILMGMDYSAGGLNHENNGDVTPMNMYPPAAFATHLQTSPTHQNMSNPMKGPGEDPGGGLDGKHGDQGMKDGMPNFHKSDEMQNPGTNLSRQNVTQQPIPLQNAPQAPPAKAVEGYVEPNPVNQVQSNANLDISAPNAPAAPHGENTEKTAAQPVVPQYRNAYSSSGFDMLGVLMRVATRPKPLINIGAVDMSCAFAVCDVTQHDIPIVYCSDIFERLTGYTKHEILGRNCRFLQAPDGKIQAGVKRKYVDDHSVLRIKNMINQRQEMQISIINYRKGGQPFMNLLTMIPITWDSEEVKYYVGFQVDLVEQPMSITNKNPGQQRKPCSLYVRKLTQIQMALIPLITHEGCYPDIKSLNTTISRTPTSVRLLAGTKFQRY